MSFLGFLRRREDAPLPPTLASEDRKRLEHRRRRLAQALRQADRRIAAHNCASCLKREEDPRLIQLDRQRKAIEVELERLDSLLWTGS